MYYKGEFLTRKGRRVTVHIVTRSELSPSVEIGSAGLYFAPDPVEVEDQTNDVFDVLQPRTATVRLLTESWHADLFAANPVDNVVNIEIDGRLEFAGFIEPQTYSQPFNDRYETVELNCLDVLAALQYLRYRDADTAWAPYGSILAACGPRTFADIVDTVLSPLLSCLDITGRHSTAVLWDGSVKEENLWHRLTVNDRLFLGADEDGVWSCRDVAEALLRYLGLNAVAEGASVCIYNRESVKGGKDIEWHSVADATEYGTTEPRCVELTPAISGGTDATLSMSECWNRVSVACDVQETDTVVEDPLDAGDTDSPYPASQLYLTEYTLDKEGDREAFWRSVRLALSRDEDEWNKENIWCRGFKKYDWSVRVLTHPKWKFRLGSSMFGDPSAFMKQHDVADRLGQSPIEAAMLQWTKTETDLSGKDTAVVADKSETTELVIATSGSFSGEGGSQVWDDLLVSHAPLAEFRDNTAAPLSPADPDTTNYIVISGKVFLNPLMREKDSAKKVLSHIYNIDDFPNDIWGTWFVRRWWKADNPLAAPETDWDMTKGFCPVNGWWPEKKYRYNYSAVGDSVDRVKKLPVMACMLVIGDKCLVENPDTGAMTWEKYDEQLEVSDREKYLAQSFTVGIDPAIGDYIVGEEHPIQNTVDYRMNIDAEGLAIPVRASDGLSGAVKFAILGPVNLEWKDITKRHRTWFRREKWTEDTVPLLNEVESIHLRGFSVKIYSDDGGRQRLQGKELVYTSDDGETYLNRRDDLTFQVHSALTASERDELGVVYKPSLSMVTDAATGHGVTALDFGHGAEKPEVHYVNAAHEEVCEPRAELETTLQAGAMTRWDCLRHPAIGVPMYVLRRSLSLMGDMEKYTLRAGKEVANG